MSLKRTITALVVLITGFVSGQVLAGTDVYQVRITNLTRGETFTPIMVATHKKGVKLFELGSKASQEVVAVAESGNIAPLSSSLMATGKVYDIQNSGGLLAPGESVTVEVMTKGSYKYISLIGMLIPTNDGFIAVNGTKGPMEENTMTLYSPAYDAGSENNDELCANIPGPYCKGAALSPEDGEGYVHIHGGIKGDADLDAATFDWRNPVAKISIKRIEN